MEAGDVLLKVLMPILLLGVSTAVGLLVWSQKDLSRRVRDLEIHDAGEVVRSAGLGEKLDAIHIEVREHREDTKRIPTLIRGEISDHERRCPGYRSARLTTED